MSVLCLNLFLYCLCISFMMLISFLLFAKMVYYIYPTGKPGKLHIAFFHPYCNAGGGGERVLWLSIKSIQERYEDAECYVYTGDVDSSPDNILTNVKKKFNVELPRPPQFIFLKFRRAVEAKYYPYFTLLGQSMGSIVLAMEALSKFRPQIYIDTMGYAFTYPVFRFLGGCTVGCYTHYPTISSDMLGKVSDRTTAHNNREFITNSLVLSLAKLVYYNAFAFVYGMVGKCSQVIMVNSTWTRDHIASIWKCDSRIHTVFPPCNTAKFSNLSLLPDNEKTVKSIVSIGQFRPEKDYPLQLRSFKRLLDIWDNEKVPIKLVLIGGVRDVSDENRVHELQSLSRALGIDDKVEWKINASFDELIDEVQRGTIGLHTMWNEHFGIGIVESMAGGLIMIANDSGGPKFDILVPLEDDQETGFLASDETSYSERMKYILNLSEAERTRIRIAGRKSVQRFSDTKFSENFISAMSCLLDSL